jgi:signal transduction histidine kinase
VARGKDSSLFTYIEYRLDQPEAKALSARKKLHFFSAICLTTVFLLSLIWRFVARVHVNTLTHSLLESYCGLIALLIAYIIFREYFFSGKKSGFYLFIAFFAMGVFDFFHAYSNDSAYLFVWYHNVTALTGGIFFLLGALFSDDSREDPLQLRKFLILVGSGVILAAAFLLSKYYYLLPDALSPGAHARVPVDKYLMSEFSAVPKLINIFAACCFLSAGLLFVKRFSYSNDMIHHIFSLSALLFFESELLFGFSKLWDPTWWYWHIIKLLIYAGLLTGIAYSFTRNFYELRESKLKLMELVEELKFSYESLKKTQTELLTAEKLASVGKFAAMVAHEIRNPLSAISNSIGIFKRYGALSSEDEELLRIIKNEIKRLENFTTDFLEFSRPLVLEKSFTDLNGLIEETLGMFMRSHPEIEIQKSFRLLPDVLMDGDAFRRCLWNILNNSAQAMPGGGSVFVRTSRAPDINDGEQCREVLIRISDTGAGIHNETLPRVFEPFFSTKTKGTGLGMSIVQKIISQHGGSVSISSEEGKGTEVIIRLPFAALDSAVLQEGVSENGAHIGS